MTTPKPMITETETHGGTVVRSLAAHLTDMAEEVER